MPQALQGFVIDKKIPVAVILALLMQTTAGVWWVSSLSATVADHGRKLAAVERVEAERARDERALYARLSTIEATLTGMRASLARIEGRLERQDR